MKPLHIFISAIFIFIIGAFYKELQYKSIPQRGITIIHKQNGTGSLPNSTQKVVAHLPFPTRKRWLATILKKRIWQKTDKWIKSGKKGKKMSFSAKQSVRLKKIVFNPA